MSTWTRQFYLKHLAASRAPILIGPWRSEVGFHALYFQPWLAAWRAKYAIDPDRLIVVAPGGSAVWHHPCRQVELLDHLSLTHLRQALYVDAHEKGSLKQLGITPQERGVLALVAANLNLRRYHVLHPSLMYQDLAPWFEGQRPLMWAMDRLTVPEKQGRRCLPLAVPNLPLGTVLPEAFLAVKFYARATFPQREDLRDWVEQYVEQLSRKLPVVLLQTNLDPDDHQDFPVALGPRVFSIAAACTPHNNLAIQTAVLAKAKGFVGTYGGMQQLALRLGIPSAGYFTDFQGTLYAHREWSEYLALQQGTPWWIGRPHEAEPMKLLLGG